MKKLILVLSLILGGASSWGSDFVISAKPNKVHMMFNDIPNGPKAPYFSFALQGEWFGPGLFQISSIRVKSLTKYAFINCIAYKDSLAELFENLVNSNDKPIVNSYGDVILAPQSPFQSHPLICENVKDPFDANFAMNGIPADVEVVGFNLENQRMVVSHARLTIR